MNRPTFYQQSILLDDQLVWSVLEYLEQAGTVKNASREWPLPVEEAGGEDMKGDWAILDSWHSHTLYMHLALSKSPPSPLSHVPFKPFRRFGFAIWSKKRLAAYGFSFYTWHPEEQRLTWDRVSRGADVDNTWRSILSEAELADVMK